jgi:hypothetical protein
MTITAHGAGAKHAGARDTDAEDRAAVLKMMRADAIVYVTALFDWLGEGQPGAEMANVRACFDAREKRFHEVLAGIIKSAEENNFGYQYLCTARGGCRCISCRYPAEDPYPDMRPPWTLLMVNVRAVARLHAEDGGEPC